MPYTGGDDPNLPNNVKKKSPKARRAWAKIWNSSYLRCVKRKGKPLSDASKKACEGEAFRIANGMLKKMEIYYEGGRMDEIFYIDLAQLTSGKTFDALVPGSFVDMLGRKVIFKKSDLASYVKNTKDAIEATTTESGEIVGLPIDARGHDKGDAAGWIVDALLENNKVRLIPKWTEDGLELIQKGIRRFFSPTVDTRHKVILGGTLTNWPATRDKKGKILLRPVELENEDFFVVDEDQKFEELEDDTDFEASYDEIQNSVSKAFKDQFLSKTQKQVEMTPWVIEVFEDHAIIRDNGKYFSAGFSTDDKGNVTFDGKSSWKEVKRTWIEAALDKLKDATDTFKKALLGEGVQSAGETEPAEQSLTLEVLDMEFTKEELQEMIKLTVGESMRDLIVEMSKDAAPDPDAESERDGEGKDKTPFDVLQFLELEGAGDEYVDEVKKAMVELYDQTRKRGAEEAAKLIANVRREAHVNEFVNHVVAGTEENPRGIAVEADELQKFILALDPDQAEFFQKLVEKIVSGKGVVEFSELGHGKKMEGVTPLPEYYAEKLRNKELTLDDLKDPMLALGDLKEYDLSEFRSKE